MGMRSMLLQYPTLLSHLFLANVENRLRKQVNKSSNKVALIST